MEKFQKPRGTQDIYGTNMQYWHYLETIISKLTKEYQFQEMRTPMFESYELFNRGIGETSDIVSKEMYDFYDKGDRHLTLKPESTAAIVRSYIENKLYAEGDFHKYYYIAPHFRYERAQSGRYRQHHQFGVEVFGDKNPYIDAEVILLATTFLQQIGLTGFQVHINSLGDAASRLTYRTVLQDYFRPYLSELCSDCQVRFNKNPLRILDCKKDAKHPIMQTVPKMRDYLFPDAKKYMENILKILDDFQIDYIYDNHLVRGLDYYTHTVFEIILTHPTTAKAGSLCGGGRYDGLVEQIGGPATSGIGFGMGMERLILALKDQGVSLPAIAEQRIFVANLDENSQIYAAEIVQTLRLANKNVATNYTLKSMKSIFKMADRYQATDLLIIGASEMQTQTITHKKLVERVQTTYNKTELLTKISEEGL